MSMWEFEALTESAVRFANETDLSLPEKRTLFANLYDLQDQFDCSFTHFRQPKTLMDAQFFFRIDVDQHPGYEANQAYFQGVVDAGEDAWVKLPEETGYGDTFYSAGSRNASEEDIAPGLYFDVRGSLWPRAVAAGLLTGDAAAPFERWGPDQLLAEVLTLAAAQPPSDQRHGIIKGYYGWMLAALPEILKPPTLANASLAAARDLAEVRGALALPVPAPDDWIDERLLPRREHAKYHEGDAKAVFEWLMDAYPASE